MKQILPIDKDNWITKLASNPLLLVFVQITDSKNLNLAYLTHSNLNNDWP
jgi:hypothetical protein